MFTIVTQIERNVDESITANTTIETGMLDELDDREIMGALYNIVLTIANELGVTTKAVIEALARSADRIEANSSGIKTESVVTTVPKGFTNK